VRTRGTYFLESAEEGISHYSEGGRASEEHSRSGERGGRVKSETAKESKRARGTHFLESAEERRTQDSQETRAGREDSLSGEHGGRDISKQGKKARE
jgi:hypothetical protein